MSYKINIKPEGQNAFYIEATNDQYSQFIQMLEGGNDWDVLIIEGAKNQVIIGRDIILKSVITIIPNA